MGLAACAWAGSPVSEVQGADSRRDIHFDVGMNAVHILALAFQEFVATIQLVTLLNGGCVHLGRIGACLRVFASVEILEDLLAVLVHLDEGDCLLKLVNRHVSFIFS